MKPKYLNDLEADSISQFVENPVLVSAVKKVLLSGIYFEGIIKEGEDNDPKQNFLLALSNKDMPAELLGYELKARAEGIKLLEKGFQKLLRFQKVESNKSKLNQAR